MLGFKVKNQYLFTRLCCLVIFTLLLTLTVIAGPFSAPQAAYATSSATLSVGSVTGQAGDTVTVPVTLTSAGDVAGIQFDLGFDHNLLTNTGKSFGALTNVLDEDEMPVFTIATQLQSPDLLRVVIYSGTNTLIASGTGTLVNLKFQVAAGANPGQSCNLTLSTVVVTDGGSPSQPIPTTTVNGQFSVPGALIQPPALAADSTDNTVGQDMTITFSDNPVWRDAITAVTLNGTTLNNTNGTLYSVTSGNLTLDKSLFKAAGDYTVVVRADGYSDATVTQTVLAAPVTPAADFNYTIGSDSKITITGYKGSGGRVSIPGTINDNGTDYPVTAIGFNAFQSQSAITSVIIPDSVTSIAEGAFEGCSRITSLTLSNNLLSIDPYAFANCSGLASVTLPASLTTVSGFNGCTGLTTITIPAGVATIGDNAFLGCTELESVHFAETGALTAIGAAAFSNCTKLATLPIPAGVASIGNSAFHGCTGLGSLTLSASLTSIGDESFNGCTNLTLASPTLPQNLTSIGQYAFQGCQKLTAVILPAALTTIETYAFQDCTGLTSVTFSLNSRNLTTLNLGVFQGCTGLSSVQLPEGLTSLSGFAGCTSLETVTLPSSLKTITDNAFSNCSKITSLTLPEGLESLAGLDGTGLETLNLPSTLTAIGMNAFKGCTNLTSLTLPANLTSIGASTFAGCAGLTSIKLPSGLTAIGSYAFQNCPLLTSVTLPDSLKTISGNAFQNCTGLASLVLPSSLSSIGASSFKGCSNLGSAYFLGGKPATFGTNVFQNTKAGFTLYYHAGTSGWDGFSTYPAKAFSVLTLDRQDGSNPASSFAVIDGGHLAAPTNPTRPGFTFGGWYTEAACSTAFDFSSETVNGDVTVYALWTQELAAPPSLTADSDNNTVGQDMIITFSDNATWRDAISAVLLNGTTLNNTTGNILYNVTTGNIVFDHSLFTAAGDYTVTVQAAGYNDATVTQQVTAAGKLDPPALTADDTNNTVGQDMVITFSDNAAWRDAISAVLLNGTTLNNTTGNILYNVTSGNIIFDHSLFALAGDYLIKVQAAGYGDATVTQQVTAAQHPVYTLTPVGGDAYTCSKNTDGINLLTVKSGINKLVYFTVNVTPPAQAPGHEGKETVVFTHLRANQVLELNAVKADFDTTSVPGVAGFNVQSGDVIKVYLVDDLSNDSTFNPTPLE